MTIDLPDEKNNRNDADKPARSSGALLELMLEMFALYQVSKRLDISFPLSIRQVDLVKRMYGVSKNQNASFEMGDVFEESEAVIERMIGKAEFSIMLLDDVGGTLAMWKADCSRYDAVKNVTFDLGEGICGTVAQTGEAIISQNVLDDARFLYFKGTHPDIGSFYCAPLKTAAGKTIGVFNVHKTEPNAFKDRDIAVFDSVALHLTGVIKKTKQFKEKHNQAITDELTRLYSRRYFMEILNREISDAKRREGVFSVVMLDVDRFKNVNDQYGHGEGDIVLKKIASTLKQNTRNNDVLARYGGDEIIVFLRGIEKAQAALVAEKLLDKVKSGVSISNGDSGDATKRVSISAGVAIFPESGSTVDEIIESADKALYIAKNSGRGRVCFAQMD